MEGRTLSAYEKVYLESPQFCIKGGEREYSVETVRLSKLPSIYIGHGIGKHGGHKGR